MPRNEVRHEQPEKAPVQVLIVAVPETAGSALYEMLDVPLGGGHIWQNLVRSDSEQTRFAVRIVSPGCERFRRGNGAPVRPDVCIASDAAAAVLILLSFWLGPDEPFQGRYADLMDWIRRQHWQGATLCLACSCAVTLAASGLLDACQTTSRWGYPGLFRRQYLNVNFRPEPNLLIVDRAGRIVTTGGTSAWHHLVLHVISPHGSPRGRSCVSKRRNACWEGNTPR